MTRIRQRIAERFLLHFLKKKIFTFLIYCKTCRLKSAQNVAAMLTTFQEVDMGPLIDLRNKYKDDFEKKHGVKLGFMSAFVKVSKIIITLFSLFFFFFLFQENVIDKHIFLGIISCFT